jgi:hypothetical protein
VTLRLTLIAIMCQTQLKVMLCESLYPTALGLEEQTQAFVSASIKIKNRLLKFKDHGIISIVASSK